MIYKIGAQIRIYNPVPEVINWAKSDLTMPNPDYEKKQRMGLWLGKTPKTIQLYEMDGDCIVVPYGCFDVVMQYLRDEDAIKYEFFPSVRTPRDTTYGGPASLLSTLYDYQVDALRAMKCDHNGILQAPPGSGKTQIGLAYAAYTGKKTLWITHTTDLLNQSRDRAMRYFDKSCIGTISAGKVKIGSAITFATIQTLSKLDLLQYRRTWSCIIIDECHHVAKSPTSVTMYEKVLNNLAAPYKWGLSATVHRADGLIKATHALLGPIRYSVPPEAVAERTVNAVVIPRFTGCGIPADALDTDGTIVYTKLITGLTNVENRNLKILNDLTDNGNYEHYNLILSDRIAHLEWLMNNLPEKARATAVMVTGKMTSKMAKAERERAIEDMREGKKHYLFATYALAKEGLDIPRLDRLYLASPQKDYAVIAQAIGRIQRVAPEKGEPIAYDYVDENSKMLRNMYRKRCQTYRKCCCTLKEAT